MKKSILVALVAAPLFVGPAQAQDTGASLKAYQNYDFVPGEQIVFDDNFAADGDGEFPAHWKLGGPQVQAVVNQVDGRPVVVVSGGADSRLVPRMKSDKYLGDAFTVEFDFYPVQGTRDTEVLLLQDRKFIRVAFTDGLVNVAAPSVKGFVELRVPYADSERGRAFVNRWHHAALAVRGGQLKVYLDQYRLAVQPDLAGFQAERFEMSGWPERGGVRFTNVRVANGGGMNLVDKLTKDGRAVTHGITFDTGKATIKPESMGTIHQIEAALNKDTTLKIEIDGHTDSDGDAAGNQRLSEARAEAVKQVLVSDGVDAARLQTHGFGATKPITANDTLEGKANNRRVEFVRL